MQYYEAIYARLMIEATGQGSAAKYCPEMVWRHRLTRLCLWLASIDRYIRDCTMRGFPFPDTGRFREKMPRNFRQKTIEGLVTQTKSTPPPNEVTRSKCITTGNNWHLFKTLNSLRETRISLLVIFVLGFGTLDYNNINIIVITI